MHVLLTTYRSREDTEPTIALTVKLQTLGGEVRG